MCSNSGHTTRMLEKAIQLVPSTGNSMPIVIIGKNYDHLTLLMKRFGKIAVDRGYNIRATGRYRFLVDEEARVEFTTYQGINKMAGVEFVEIFVDSHAKGWRFNEELAFVIPQSLDYLSECTVTIPMLTS